MDGVVLQALPFGERDRILTLITCEGVVKCFMKLPARPHLTRLALATPFTRGEYHLGASKSQLYRFIDGTPIQQHLGLRASLDRLETAQKMAKLLLETQWPGKPSHGLYDLFVAFLAKISESDERLFGPFLIKFLKYEGQLDPSVFEHPEAVEQIAKATSWAHFPKVTKALEGDIYSKVMELLAASI